MNRDDLKSIIKEAIDESSYLLVEPSNNESFYAIEGFIGSLDNCLMESDNFQVILKESDLEDISIAEGKVMDSVIETIKTIIDKLVQFVKNIPTVMKRVFEKVKYLISIGGNKTLSLLAKNDKDELTKDVKLKVIAKEDEVKSIFQDVHKCTEAIKHISRKIDGFDSKEYTISASILQMVDESAKDSTELCNKMKKFTEKDVFIKDVTVKKGTKIKSAYNEYVKSGFDIVSGNMKSVNNNVDSIIKHCNDTILVLKKAQRAAETKELSKDISKAIAHVSKLSNAAINIASSLLKYYLDLAKVYSKNAASLSLAAPGAYIDKTKKNIDAYLKNKDDIRYNKDKFDSGEVNLCFITGYSGSGKSSLGAEYAGRDNVDHNDLDQAVFVFNVAEQDLKKPAEGRGELYEAFFKGPGAKYRTDKDTIEKLKTRQDKVLDNMIREFVDYSKQYASSHKNQKFIVEGVWLYMFIKPEELKDYAVFVKGTAALISSVRAATRDYDDRKERHVDAATRYTAFIKKIANDQAKANTLITSVRKYTDYFGKLYRKQLEDAKKAEEAESKSASSSEDKSEPKVEDKDIDLSVLKKGDK